MRRPVSLCLAALTGGLISSARAQSDARSAIAVLELASKNVPPAELELLSDRLRIELFRTGKFDVLERQRMQEILSEQGLQQSECMATECAVEIGMLIGVERMVAGSVGRVGSLHTINVRLINVETGRMERIAVKDCSCSLEEVLTRVMSEVAGELAGDPVPATVTAPAMQPPTPQPAVVPLAPTHSSTRTRKQVVPPARREPSKWWIGVAPGYSFALKDEGDEVGDDRYGYGSGYGGTLSLQRNLSPQVTVAVEGGYFSWKQKQAQAPYDVYWAKVGIAQIGHLLRSASGLYGSVLVGRYWGVYDRGYSIAFVAGLQRQIGTASALDISGRYQMLPGNYQVKTFVAFSVGILFGL